MSIILSISSVPLKPVNAFGTLRLLFLFSIKLKAPVEGKLTFKLIYKKFDSNLIFLDQDDNEYKFAFDEIDTCKLIPDFEKILRKENG